MTGDVVKPDDDSLGRWPISIQIPVLWGDLDALNHVNHTVFLRWMETARMVYFERCGMMEMMDSNQIGPILASLRADYSVPVHFPDTITAHATMSRLGNSSFEMDYRITSKANNGTVVATGSVTGVLCDYNEGKSVSIPNELRNRILQTEATNSS